MKAQRRDARNVVVRVIRIDLVQIAFQIQIMRSGAGFYTFWVKIEDGDTDMIQDFLFLCRKIGSIFSPYNIFWKLPFCFSPCSGTIPAKCDFITLLHSKSRKKCHKNYEYRLTKEN